MKHEGVVYLSNPLMHENCKLTKLNQSSLLDEFVLYNTLLNYPHLIGYLRSRDMK
mgnify:CR=1 FL=1